ncbi:Protein MAIN-LIKE 1 [Glycine soja]
MNFDGICGRHLQIMVRTRGLSRALGRVIGRGLGRDDRDDSDDAPQRRRPTASACRQQVPVTVADDEPVVPATEADVPVAEADVLAAEASVAVDEPMVDADIQDTGVDTGECPELKLSSHGRKVQKLGRPVPTIEGLVAGTGLSPLIACSVDTDDQGLISSFVEKWYWKTSSFHLPVGEVTIMLDDVASLLHLPIVGKFHTFEPLHLDEAVLMFVDLLLVSPEAARAETGHCHGPYICLSWQPNVYQRRCQAGPWTPTARAYLLHLLGCTLFANKSATHVHVVFLDALCDLSQFGRYAWGAAALCWIYEHFPSVAECNTDSEYDDASPCACRWIATKKTMNSISTETYRQCLDRLRILDGPVAIRYRPERVMRQFGYVQSIPAPPVDSWVSFDEIDDRWMHYSDHLALAGEMCTSVPQRDAPATQPRHIPHIPQVLEPHIPLVPEPTATSTPATSDVDEPKHVVEACHAITERLECHFNLGVVTPGTLTHEVIEQCLRIARGVTEDRIVYVRSRHRRCTDQP